MFIHVYIHTYIYKYMCIYIYIYIYICMCVWGGVGVRGCACSPLKTIDFFGLDIAY